MQNKRAVGRKSNYSPQMQIALLQNKRAVGRKSNYSPQIALCRWLKKGCSFKDAFAMEGISYETFRTWQSEKSVFSVAIKKAEAECKVARIQTILKASDKSWQAAFMHGRSWLPFRMPSPVVLQGKSRTLHKAIAER